MPRPASRADLLGAIDTELARLMAQVQQVPPADRLRPGACGDWSVKDLLSYLDAWHEIFLGWEAVGSRGGKPEMPAPGHTWATTPALNEEIRRRHQDEPWDQVAARLAAPPPGCGLWWSAMTRPACSPRSTTPGRDRLQWAATPSPAPRATTPGRLA